MDLSTLTKLTREQLDTFAKREGIANPERSSTAELVATLLNQRVQTAERALRHSKRGGAAQVAHGMLAALSQSGLLKRFARTESLPAAASKPAPPPSASAPAHPARVETASAEAPAAQTIQVEPAPAEAATHEETTRVEAAPPAVPPETTTAAEATPTQDDGVPTRRFVEEPIRTRSMARVLLSQGHRDRALSILESIVRDNPNDPAARDDLERLRADVPLDAELSRLPEPTELPTLPNTGDRVSLQTEDGRALRLAWETTDAGIARAQSVLGSTGELALRVVAITPDPTRVVRSEITERGPVEPSGDWTAPAVEPGARCFAAIGIRSGGRFVAIAHAPARTVI